MPGQIIIILFSFAFFSASCDQPVNPENTEVKAEASHNSSSSKMKSIDGFWILSEYIDGIFRDRAIAKHRMYPIAWSSLILQVRNDSLFSTGLLYSTLKEKINAESDTLCSIMEYSKYTLFYDEQSDKILAKIIEPNPTDKFKELTYHYRRIEEEAILDIINNSGWFLKRKFYFEIHQSFNDLFIDSLINGKYTSLDSSTFGKILSLNKRGETDGFQNFNRFGIHDYWGTLHPYQNLDAMLFEDTTIEKQNILPSKSEFSVFNWVFSGDTLILKEMETDTWDEWYLGKRRYKFLKSERQSH
jgi:hypothetical protein